MIAVETESEPTRAEILRAARILAGVCDGAVARDGAGYNGVDSPTAKSILAHQRPTDRQIRCLWIMLRKYREQLAGLGLDYDALVPPPAPPPGPEKMETPRPPVRIGWMHVGQSRRVAVASGYDEAFVGLMKGLKKGDHKAPPWFDRGSKSWIFPDDVGAYDALLEALEAAGRDETAEVAPELKAAMDRAREGRRTAYDASRADSSEIEVPTKISLRPFQKAGVKRIEDFGGRALVADEPGLGKTAQALGYLARHPEGLPALVVCPATLRANWVKEVGRFTDLRTLVISSKTSLKAFRNAGLKADLAPVPGYDVVVMNYDLFKTQTPKAWARALANGDLSVVPHLLEAGQYAVKAVNEVYTASKDIEAKARILEVLRKIGLQGSKSNRRRFVKVFVNGLPLEDFLAHGFRTLVLDESHYVKDPMSQRSMAVHEISRTSVSAALALTGTPVLNRVKELWSQIHAVNPDVFPKFMPFGMRYCGGKCEKVQVKGGKKGETREVWDFSGATNLEELDQILRSRVMIRRLKSQVLKELPEKIRTTIPIVVELHEYRKGAKPVLDRLATLKREREEWRALLASMDTDAQAAYLAEHAEEAARKNGLSGVAVGEIERLKQMAVAAKFGDCLEFLLDAHEQHGKVVVFTAHHETTDRLVEALRGEGLNVGWIDGRVPGADREPVKTRFQEGDLEFLVCGIRAASEGLTLTASHTVVKVEYDWNPARHLQAEDRCHRITQAHAVNIYYLVAIGTIEEKIVAMIDAKREVMNAALGEAQRTLDEEGILDALLDAVGKEAAA